MTLRFGHERECVHSVEVVVSAVICPPGAAQSCAAIKVKLDCLGYFVCRLGFSRRDVCFIVQSSDVPATPSSERTLKQSVPCCMYVGRCIQRKPPSPTATDAPLRRSVQFTIERSGCKP